MENSLKVLIKRHEHTIEHYMYLFKVDIVLIVLLHKHKFKGAEFSLSDYYKAYRILCVGYFIQYIIHSGNNNLNWKLYLPCFHRLLIINEPVNNCNIFLYLTWQRVISQLMLISVYDFTSKD